MANVSESQLVAHLVEILHSCDLDTITTNIICRSLEAEFPMEFISSRKKLIRHQIKLFLREQPDEDEDEDEEEEREMKADSENEVVLEQQQQQEEEETEQKIEEEVEEQRRKRKTSESTDTGSDLKKKSPGGFCKPCGFSPQLQEFLGVLELPKTEVVKRIWSYIRENNLQNPEDKRKIICDESLHSIFGVESINMFQMNKALSAHVWSLNEGAASSTKSPQTERQHKPLKDAAASSNKSSIKERGNKQRKEVDEPKGKVKAERSTAPNITAPLPLSDNCLTHNHLTYFCLFVRSI